MAGSYYILILICIGTQASSSGNMVDCTNTDKKRENRGEDIEEWSDDMCLRIAFEDSFPTKVKELSVQKDIINRFLNFYLSGKVQKGLSARDIIFAVISIMPLNNESEKLIWDNLHYSEDGTLLFLSPECQLKNEIKNILMKRDPNCTEDKFKKQEVHNEQINVTNVFDGEVLTNESRSETNDVDVSLNNDTIDEKVLPDKSSKDFTDDSKFQTNDVGNASDADVTDENVQSLLLEQLIWFRKKPLYAQKFNTQTIKYDPVNNAAFCSSCNKLLAKWDTDTEARIDLKYFFGIVALILMRSIVKSYEHVMQMFISRFSNKFAHTIKIIYSPPSAMCVRKTFKTFRKSDRKIKIMFAKLVINSLIKQNEKQFSPLRMNILNATILAPTSNYGMEIINLIQEVACMSGQNFMKFEAFRLKETEVSWNKIDKFLKKYLYKSNLYQPTCYWARIIDTEQFKYLTCENNYELAVLLASFIESSTLNNAIWNSRWVKSGTNLDKYKQLGHEIYEKYRKKSFHKAYV